MGHRELRARLFGVVGAQAAWGAAGALALACGGQLDEGTTASGGSAQGGSGAGGSGGSAQGGTAAAQGGTGQGGTGQGGTGGGSQGGTAGAQGGAGQGGTGAVPPLDAGVDAAIDGGGPAMSCAQPGTLPVTDDSGFYGLFTQCFTAAELAPYVVAPSSVPIGQSCAGGLMCPTVGALGFTGCDSFQQGPAAGEGGTCCYVMSCDCCGRPFRVEGWARRAGALATPAWSAAGDADGHAAAHPDPALRAALRAAWLADALAEHASVASFARAALGLQRLGAPAGLVGATLRAGLDEVEHARLCFALAGAQADAPLGPGPLALGGVRAAGSLAELAADVFVEACLGETVAAAVAAEQLAEATEPRARAALARIAEDEAAHAELGWRTLGWALAAGGAPVRHAVERAAARTLAAVDCAPTAEAPTPADDAWSAHGRLRPAARAAIEALVRRSIVEPCLAALLAPAVGPARPRRATPEVRS